jgi:hypothetical protein
VRFFLLGLDSVGRVVYAESMNNVETAQSLPLYPRIVEWASLYLFGEDYLCWGCKEAKAVCPDCGTAICVFCEDACDECGGSMF